MYIAQLLQLLHAGPDRVLTLGGVLGQLVYVEFESVRLGQHIGEQAASFKGEAFIMK
ncbi:hypothetical protein D3C77_648280 [compost metagenome]